MRPGRGRGRGGVGRARSPPLLEQLEPEPGDLGLERGDGPAGVLVEDGGVPDELGPLGEPQGRDGLCRRGGRGIHGSDQAGLGVSPPRVSEEEG